MYCMVYLYAIGLCVISSVIYFILTLFLGKEKKKRRKKKANVAIASIENVDFEENCEPGETQLRTIDNEEKREEKSANNFTSFDRTKSTKDTSSVSTNQPYPASQNSNVSTERKSGYKSSTSLDVANEQGQEEFGFSLNYPETTSHPQIDNKMQIEKSQQSILQNLNLKSEDAKKDLTFQKDLPSSQRTDDGPLVELSSGLSLTPVSCPDEAKMWGLHELDDSESPRSEGVVDSSSSVKLFGGLTRNSPVSRLVEADARRMNLREILQAPDRY